MKSTPTSTTTYYQMKPEEIQAFQTTFMKWYDANKRDLPWRKDQEPYHVWLSEIMLQQTQVKTVIPYYLNFLKLFPTVADLAAASSEQLLKAWEGLGYYSRARNLQKAAQQIMTDYQGVWPDNAKDLQALAGIGPYTAGAIASICFNEVVPAVDGNAFRVFSRLLKIDADIADPKSRRVFETAITPLIPVERPGDFNQAVMDFGSQVCTAKNPTVATSPLAPFFQSLKDDTLLDYPVKTKKVKIKVEKLYGLMLIKDNQVLLQKRPSKGLLANLSTVPLVKEAELLAEQQTRLTKKQATIALNQYFKAHYQIDLANIQLTQITVTHVFTHLKWQVQLVTANVEKDADLAYFNGFWQPIAALETLALPTLQKKIWQSFQEKI